MERLFFFHTNLQEESHCKWDVFHIVIHYGCLLVWYFIIWVLLSVCAYLVSFVVKHSNKAVTRFKASFKWMCDWSWLDASGYRCFYGTCCCISCSLFIEHIVVFLHLTFMIITSLSWLLDWYSHTPDEVPSVNRVI